MSVVESTKETTLGIILHAYEDVIQSIYRNQIGVSPLCYRLHTNEPRIVHTYTNQHCRSDCLDDCIRRHTKEEYNNIRSYYSRLFLSLFFHLNADVKLIFSPSSHYEWKYID